jgi:two-component system LytT family response regulator
MKRYRAIIIDDEKNLSDALAVMLADHCPDILLRGIAASASDGRELLKKEQVDFIFLDISMPDEDGFTFLRSIPKENYGVIFVTSHEEYSLLALKASAIDYLMKPVNPEELEEAVAKAIHYHELRQSKAEVRSIYHESLENLHQQVHSETRKIEKITIAEQFGFRIVNTADLMYLEADSNYTNLHLSDSKKVTATRTLGEFEKILDEKIFFRIHKSTIINLSHLKAYSSYQGNYAEMADGSRLAISRRKLNEFREVVMMFSRGA